MKCFKGVDLLAQKGVILFKQWSDSIQEKPNNQTHNFVSRLRQSLQPNKGLWLVPSRLDLPWLTKSADLEIGRKPNNIDNISIHNPDTSYHSFSNGNHVNI
jgi:hypothetical protein